MANHPADDAVVVIGLGRFGGAVALSLMELGHEVLGIDSNAEIVQAWAERLRHVVQADTTNTEALRRLGVADFPRAVVAIGSDIEASVLTVLGLTELAIPDIWAKALTEKHGRILERTGAHHVIYPEADMGRRVAHLVASKMIDFMEFEGGYGIGKTRVPPREVGKTLSECMLRSRFGVTVVGVKRVGRDFVHATEQTTLESGDILVVAGPTQKIEAFAALT
ncbi:MAG: TrkA family potassium uptake protein [Rubritepida sp.]|nr:TrkA family potassium uptake protein [Rubritepida sp.]